MDKRYNKVLIILGIVACIFIFLVGSTGLLGYMAYKPFMADKHYNEGVRYKHKGWVKKSKEMMNKAIDTAPNSISAKKAKRFLKTKLPKSDNISDKAISLNIKAHNLQTKANNIPSKEEIEYNNKIQETIETYKEAIKESPEFEWPYSNIGRIYFNEGKDYITAESYFKKALKINPDYFNARSYLGLTYFKMAMIEKNKENYEETIVLLKKALKELKKAHELDPDDDRLLENLSDTEAYLKLVQKKEKSS